MNSSKALRFFIILEWLLFLILIPATIVSEYHLPIPLQEWINSSPDEGLTTYFIILLILALPLLALWLVGSIGLFLFKRWAAWVYLASYVFGLLLLPLSGPTVEHVVVTLISYVLSLNSGIILGIAFFAKPYSQNDV